MTREQNTPESYELHEVQEQHQFSRCPPIEPAIKTPSGGRVFHPFHDNFLDQLGCVAVTPGMFSRSTHQHSNDNGMTALGEKTPLSRETYDRQTAPIPFVWSPEVQGDHFPKVIDENPALQHSLQNMLDADVRHLV